MLPPMMSPPGTPAGPPALPLGVPMLPPVATSPAPTVPDGPGPDVQNQDQFITELEAPMAARLAYKNGSANAFHAKVLQRLVVRRNASLDAYVNRRRRWDEVDDHMQMRIDLTAGARQGDGTRDYRKKEMPVRRSVVIPISFATLMVRHTQELSLLLSREPEMQIEGTGPEDADGAKLMEARIAYDLRETRYPLCAHQLVFDLERYGLAAWYITWEREFGTKISAPLIQAGKHSPIIEGIVRMLYPGAFEIGREWALKREYNRIQPVNPRRFYRDPRRSVADLQQGEWCGHGWDTGFMGLKTRGAELDGPYFNLDAVRKFCGGRTTQADNGQWEGSRDVGTPYRGIQGKLDEQDGGTYHVDHLQVRLIPSEWDLGDSDKPEIWWFTWVDDEVIIRAHPSGYPHDEFTYAACEGIPDAHSLENPGWGEQLNGLQLIGNWLFNVRVDSLRKMLNGGGLLYSPSWMNERDITHPNIGGNIRITKEAEEMLLAGNRPIQSLYGQLMTQDPTGGHLRDLQFVMDMTQRLTGASDPMQGMALPDKRTLGEVNALLASSSQRIGTTVRLADSMAIHSAARQMIANAQRWTSTEQWYRIPGDLAKELEGRIQNYGSKLDNRGGVLRALINRNDLWGDYDYVPHSGNISVDPAKSPDTWMKGLGVLGQIMPMMMNPQLNPEGKIPDFRAWATELLRSLGIKNVESFWRSLPPPPPPPPPGAPGAPGMPMAGPGGPVNVKVLPDAQVAAGVQAGNLV